MGEDIVDSLVAEPCADSGIGWPRQAGLLAY